MRPHMLILWWPLAIVALISFAALLGVIPAFGVKSMFLGLLLIVAFLALVTPAMYRPAPPYLLLAALILGFLITKFYLRLW